MDTPLQLQIMQAQLPQPQNPEPRNPKTPLHSKARWILLLKPAFKGRWHANIKIIIIYYFIGHACKLRNKSTLRLRHLPNL